MPVDPWSAGATTGGATSQEAIHIRRDRRYIQDRPDVLTRPADMVGYMRPSVPDDVVDELNEKTNDQFRVPSDRLEFKDRLRALFDRIDQLEQTNENLRERLRSDQRVIQSTGTDSSDSDDDRRGDSAASFL